MKKIAFAAALAGLTAGAWAQTTQLPVKPVVLPTPAPESKPVAPPEPAAVEGKGKKTAPVKRGTKKAVAKPRHKPAGKKKSRR